MADYVKLGQLVDDQFTVEKVWGYQFQKWDDVEKKMLRSDTYEQGYRKVYNLDTNKGKLTLGSGQVGNLLEAVLKDGVADLNGKTFSVKRNGKTEKDIRYFFNVARAEEAKKPEVVTDVDMENELDLSAIPF